MVDDKQQLHDDWFGTKTAGSHKIPNGALVEVSGNVMLKGVKPGTYRIEHGSPEGKKPTYQFFKPKGSRPVARHFADSVDRTLRPEGHGDLNKTEIVRKASTKTAGARFDPGGPWQAEDEDGRYFDVTIDKGDIAGRFTCLPHDRGELTGKCRQCPRYAVSIIFSHISNPHLSKHDRVSGRLTRSTLSRTPPTSGHTIWPRRNA